MGYPAVTDSEHHAVVTWFPRLEKCLASVALPTSEGKARKVSADEFMLMSDPGPNGSQAAFKHSFTRRYVYVRMDAGRPVLEMEPGGFYDECPY